MEKEMTLKEKFYPYCDNEYSEKWVSAENCEDIAEEFAIEFHNWMRSNDTQENADKWFHYTDKDMLNAFKEEKKL
jgi:hypothetical protein